MNPVAHWRQQRGRKGSPGCFSGPALSLYNELQRPLCPQRPSMLWVPPHAPRVPSARLSSHGPSQNKHPQTGWVSPVEVLNTTGVREPSEGESR